MKSVRVWLTKCHRCGKKWGEIGSENHASFALFWFYEIGRTIQGSKSGKKQGVPQSSRKIEFSLTLDLANGDRSQHLLRNPDRAPFHIFHGVLPQNISALIRWSVLIFYRYRTDEESFKVINRREWVFGGLNSRPIPLSWYQKHACGFAKWSFQSLFFFSDQN